MSIENILQQLNVQGSKVYGKLNDAYNALDSAAGGRLPYGVAPPTSTKVDPVPPKDPPRPTEPFVSGRDTFTEADRTSPVTKYINEIPEKGAVPAFTVNPTHEALMTAVKYAAGPLGKPIRLIRSPGTGKRLQEQVDGASVRDGKLYHGLGEPNYEETRFPSNVQGAGIVGQFIGNPQLNNDVTVSEPYDTKDMGWHKDKFTEHMKSGEFVNALESVGNMAFRGLSDIGWANMYPRGKEQKIGELKPDHPLYRGAGIQGYKR